jgi:hypothetical protein
MPQTKAAIPLLKTSLAVVGVIYLGLHVFAFETFIYHKPTSLILLSIAAVIVLLLQLYTEPWKQANYVRQLIIWAIIGVVFYSGVRMLSKYYFESKHPQLTQKSN